MFLHTAKSEPALVPRSCSHVIDVKPPSIILHDETHFGMMLIERFEPTTGK